MMLVVLLVKWKAGQMASMMVANLVEMRVA